MVLGQQFIAQVFPIYSVIFCSNGVPVKNLQNAVTRQQDVKLGNKRVTIWELREFILQVFFFN